MSEINERWARDNRLVKRLTGLGLVSSAILWPLSYWASTFATSIDGVGTWFSATAVVTFVAAVGLSIGTGVGVAAIATDEPPLPGSNY